MILLKYEQNCSSKTTPRVRTSSQCTVIEMHTPSPDQRSGIVLISKRPLSSSGNEALFFSRTTSGNTKLNESSHWNHVSKHPEPRYDRENFINPQKCHNPKRSVCRHTEPLPKYHTMPSVSQPQRTSTELPGQRESNNADHTEKLQIRRRRSRYGTGYCCLFSRKQPVDLATLPKYIRQ